MNTFFKNFKFFSHLVVFNIYCWLLVFVGTVILILTLARGMFGADFWMSFHATLHDFTVVKVFAFFRDVCSFTVLFEFIISKF